MINNNFNGILCSKKHNDFILLYDGLGNYYLYYQDDLLLELAEPTNPQTIYKNNNLLDTLQNIKENTKNNLVLSLIDTITRIIEDTPKNQNKIKDTLMRLLFSLKDAEKDNQYNKEFFNNAPSVIKQKAMEISKNMGYDTPLFENEITPLNVDKFNDIFDDFTHIESFLETLEKQLFDYVDNTENVFKGIIYSLTALFGYGSRFVVVNGGSEVGKSEYIETIKKLMINFENLGSSTPASIRRKEIDYFDRKLIYLGDKGLRGQTQLSREEFEGLYEVFGGLITDNEFIREIVVGDKPISFTLKSDGVCVFFSEPYTNLKVFGAGDQYSTRSSFITVNPVKDGLKVFLQDETKINEFYNIHRDYIKYILNNPIELTINDDVKTQLWQASKESLRTAYYLLGLFKAYCQYMRLSNPLTIDVNNFLKIFKPKYEVTEIEYKVYETLYNGLTVLRKEDVDDFIVSYEGEVDLNYMLLQMRDRKSKSFFTAKQIKTYFKPNFKNNKNLKDTTDQIPKILTNLFNAGLINMMEWQYKGQNVYYIPYNKDMVK